MNKVHIIDTQTGEFYDHRDFKITIKCMVTDEVHDVFVSKQDYDQWLAGCLIQDVMPYLDDSQRELLVSGVSPTGWSMMFAS